MLEVESPRGCPRLCSDALIQVLRGLSTAFRLRLRALQGFAQSLRDLAFASLRATNYTTLYRLAQTHEAQLPVVFDDEPIDLVVGSTGVKVDGAGEWKVRQHGHSKHHA